MAFRYWLLAGIVLLALIVIFKPFFYRVGQEHSLLFKEIRIPIHENTKVIVNTSAPPPPQNKANPLAYAPVSSQQNTSSQKNTLQKVDSHFISQKPMILQAGNFPSTDAANQWATQLKNKGYHAFVEQEGSNYVVYVGPVLGDKETQALKTKLEGDTKTTVGVKEYLPLKDLQ